MTQTKKPAVFAIFAHPDDEAFGPAGTIMTLAKDHEVYLVCVTRGHKGKNHDGHVDIATVREQELMASAAILGVKEVFVLDYEDGSLNNNQYHDLAADLGMLLDKHRPDTLITFDTNGISGHLDHIAIAMVATYVYEEKDYIKKILYHAIGPVERSHFDSYFVYMPPGRTEEEIDLKIDISSVWEAKEQAILCHKSQKSDVSRMLKMYRELPKHEYFRVLEKESVSL